LNLDPRQTVELADPVSFFDTPQTSLDQSLEAAWKARPELRQLLSEEQRAETELRGASDQRLPRLTVGGFWAEQGITPGSAIPVYQYQWGIDVPVFTGGRIQAERA